MSHKYLQQQLELHHIEVNEKQVQQLKKYVELLQHWNKVYNLIGNPGTREIIDRHIIDSLLVMPYIKGKTILDVGTGAGLPGIPLAIMLPSLSFSLLDSNGKKTRFVTQAKVDLRLHNVEVVNIRVEDYQHVAFDIIISRAFASLSDMLTLTQHLCVKNGEFIALKGNDAENEIVSLPSIFTIKRIERLPFVDKTIDRKIVILTATSF